MAGMRDESEAAPLLRPRTLDAGDSNDVYARPASRDGTHAASEVHDDALGSRTRQRLRIAAAMYSFVILGFFTSSLGVMLPHLEQYYHLTDIHVSLIFLVVPVGYILGAQKAEAVHRQAGQRGIASIGPFFHLLAAVIIAVHAPFPFVLAGFAVASLGTGLLDASWCAWAGGMGANANTMSGMLHGSFSTGAAIGPFLVGVLMTTRHSHWYYWFYILAGASLVEVIALPLAFWFDDAAAYRREKRHQVEEVTDAAHTRAIFKHRAIWWSSAYFLAYEGTECAISGWIVSYLARARHATPFVASLSSSTFWAGMAVGRLCLGAVTDKIGVRRATTIYLCVAVFLLVSFAIVWSPIVSVLLASMLGFSMGPLFPSGIVLLTRLLPSELHVSAVSFVNSIGQIGGAILPFAIGATVQGLGIQVVVVMQIVQLLVALGLWLAFTRVKGEGTLDEDAADEGLED